MENAEGIFGIIWLMIATIGILVMIVYLRKYKNIERMTMIEKGVDPKQFMTTYKPSNIVMRGGLFLMGVGLGLIVGYLLDETFKMEEVAYFSCIFLFGGGALILANFIEKRATENKGIQ